MKFDRMAPGEGAEVICRLENGKVFLEWRFHVREDGDFRSPDSVCIYSPEKRQEQITVKVSVTDGNGYTVAECFQILGEEEPLETILMQPCLWQGIRNPFLYHVEADLIWKGKQADCLTLKLPLRTLAAGKEVELLLNEKAFMPRAVRYLLPAGESSPINQKQIMEDFQKLRMLGANCICGEGQAFRKGSRSREFFEQLCDRFGFLLFVLQEEEIAAEPGSAPESLDKEPAAEPGSTPESLDKEPAAEPGSTPESLDKEPAAEPGSTPESLDKEPAAAPGSTPESLDKEPAADPGNAPECREGAAKVFWVCAWNPAVRLPYTEEPPLFRGRSNSLFSQEDSRPTILYYQYKARWGKDPFVYIVPESIRKLKSGNYTVTCYSSCSKTALYSDGILFAFQEGKGELVFWEVPAKGPCIRLSAEGDGVGTSFSVHKSFINFSQSPHVTN